MADGEQSRGEGSGAGRPGALSALLLEIASSPPAGGEAWTNGLRAGAVIGRVELVRELGRGGFGVVWEGRDRETGGRVAFKAVRAGARRELREERLLHEADAAARLSHPNIVKLLEASHSEHGPYLVLELLEGKTLAERLGHGPLPAHEAVRISVEIAKGLAHAHAQGIVHRDLKPENVFLCDDGQVKVLDFGLAHVFGRRRVDGGTPSYMAPEQLQGAPEDERTDVFALGVILHEMLTGKRPFEDERALRSSRAAPVLDVPWEPALGALVSRMLAKQPVKRPREAGEALRALTSFASELERAPRVIGRVGTRRRPDWRIAAALAALLALPGAAAVWWVAARDRPAPPAARPDGRVVVAVADMVNETGERELDVLSGLLVTSLEQSRRLAVMTQARVLDLAIKAGRKDVSRVDETVGREVGRANGVRVLLLPAVRRLDTTYSMEVRAIDPQRDEHLFTLSDRATSKGALLDLLDRLSERARQELREGAEEGGGARIALGTAMTPSLEAYQHYVAGVEAWHRDALRAGGLREFLEAIRLDPRFAAAHGELAILYEAYGRPDLAEPSWRAMSEGIDRMPEKERSLLRLARAHAMPGVEHWSRDDALRFADELVARYPDDKYVLASAAAAYERFIQDARAKAALRKALELDPGFFYAAKMHNDGYGEDVAETLEVARRAVATRPSAANRALLSQALRANGADAESAATAREALRLDGGRNSLVVLNACDLLHDAGAGSECTPVWKRMAEDGLNEHERDFARLMLVQSFAVQGRMREARRVLASVEEARRGHPWDLAPILSIGRARDASPEAVEVSRRIPQGWIRRNYLAFFGAVDEAERLARTIPPGPDLADRHYRTMVLVGRGRGVEALDELRAVEEEVHRRNLYRSLFGSTLLRAEALLAAGRAAEAAEAWPAPLPCRCTDPIEHAMDYPRLALVRARALERLGRHPEAVRELDGVIAFWKAADRDLPLLVEARAMRARLARAASGELPGPSIAVLPFADLSPAKDQEHLSDGIAEEILNALTQVKGLRVVGRTSSFSFKGKNADLRTIGRQLDAGSVLEGSVRRDGDRVRVTAQLVNAASGYRVWAETYERQAAGIFQVQDEIARAVVEALSVKLVPGRRVAPAIATSPEVYDLYLLGRQAYRRFSPEDFRRAVRAFERAIELDPRFAPAWSGMGIPLFYLAPLAPTSEEQQAQQRRALAAANRALELSPDLADGLSVRGFLRQGVAWDWEGARADLERAVRLYPSDADAWRRYAVLLDNLGRIDEAVIAAQKAVRLDPLGFSNLKLAWVLLAAGRVGEARRSFERAAEVLPDSAVPRYGLAYLAMHEGHAKEALAILEAMNAPPGGEVTAAIARAKYSLGLHAEAKRALEALKSHAPRPRPVVVAVACAWMDEPDCAFEWLERACRERDGELGEGVLSSSLLGSLHADPRWKALLRRMSLPLD